MTSGFGCQRVPCEHTATLWVWITLMHKNNHKKSRGVKYRLALCDEHVREIEGGRVGVTSDPLPQPILT